MADKTMSAPLAIIKVGGIAVGKMKSIRCTETIRRQKVTGLGRLTASEYVATDYDCSLTCAFYTIDLRKEVIPGALLRRVQTVEQFEDTILLQTEGVQIDILRKVENTRTATGIIIPRLEIFASIKGCFVNRESFDINEGNISGRDAEFQYTTPFLFPF